MSKINRQWRLAARPSGLIKDSDFEWREDAIPSPSEGQVLIRNVFLSIDPTYRVWMNEGESYMPPVLIGEVMRGGAVGVIEQSRNVEFEQGDIVQGLLGWQDYAIDDGTGIVKLLKDVSIPLTHYLGIFGGNGLAAYFGLMDIGQPKKGETLVVSAAAGGVGSLVGQIGKIKGCRVVGIAGSDEKCDWITKELGFDAAINYKQENVSQCFSVHCTDGIDIHSDHVAGAILAAIRAQIICHAPRGL
ncbi:MAG: NADP-dependent oxidoreductase, partial [Proteobacteria bacterium]|nr:NADP-dependent oxidoreductase [Pseudomonadota bacterium]